MVQGEQRRQRPRQVGCRRYGLASVVEMSRASLVLVILSAVASGATTAADEPPGAQPVRRHVFRFDLVGGLPVPLIIPEAGVGLSYAWFPTPRFSLEGMGTVGIMGEQLGVGVRLHYTARLFLAVRQIAFFPTGLAHDVFGSAS